ncbi:MAG: ATP-binding cassette domain-containing protein, partial [Cypionkella sp.]|nr:ATP-binding cassette domain-containing protein [Cypionkella sp.]
MTAASERLDVPQRLEVAGLTRAFGGRAVVCDVSLQVAAGQVMCLLGPSGCGKSTTLRMIAGVETPDQGRILIDGQEVFGPGVNLPPEARGVGLMFQDFALFPHLTVAGNVAFGLVGDKAAKMRRVDEL